MVADTEQLPIVINVNYELFVLGLVLLSLINALFMLVIVSPPERAVIALVERGISAFLLCDVLLRLLRARRKRAYLFASYGWMDVIGSLPLPGAGIARLLRMAIISRKLRRADYQTMGDLVVMRHAQSTLLGVLFLTVVVLELASLGILRAEAGAPHANITTASDALWWGAVTIATVGYGDRYPVTGVGRLVAVLVMTVGLGLFSVLTGFIADWFRRPRRRDLAGPVDPSARLDDVLRRLDEQSAAYRQVLQELTDLRAQLAAERAGQTPPASRQHDEEAEGQPRARDAPARQDGAGRPARPTGESS